MLSLTSRSGAPEAPHAPPCSSSFARVRVCRRVPGVCGRGRGNNSGKTPERPRQKNRIKHLMAPQMINADSGTQTFISVLRGAPWCVELERHPCPSQIVVHRVKQGDGETGQRAGNHETRCVCARKERGTPPFMRRAMRSSSLRSIKKFEFQRNRVEHGGVRGRHVAREQGTRQGRGRNGQCARRNVRL